MIIELFGSVYRIETIQPEPVIGHRDDGTTTVVYPLPRRSVFVLTGGRDWDRVEDPEIRRAVIDRQAVQTDQAGVTDRQAVRSEVTDPLAVRSEVTDPLADPLPTMSQKQRDRLEAVLCLIVEVGIREGWAELPHGDDPRFILQEPRAKVAERLRGVDPFPAHGAISEMLRAIPGIRDIIKWPGQQ